MIPKALKKYPILT